MKIQSMISDVELFTYQELKRNKLYIIRNGGWAEGLLFCPNKDWLKPDVMRGIVFKEDEISFVAWEDCPETRFELAPPETTVTLTQG